jgi:hypothetical protein
VVGHVPNTSPFRLESIMNDTPRPPVVEYGAVLGTFVAVLAGAAAVERALGRASTPSSALDLALLGAASFKTARVISRERLGSVVRQPFVEDVQAGETLKPAGHGMQQAIGELVTCTRCVGTWAAAGLLTTQVLTPRFGRLLTFTLAAGTANDFLQAGFAALCGHAPERADD